MINPLRSRDGQRQRVILRGAHWCRLAGFLYRVAILPYLRHRWDWILRFRFPGLTDSKFCLFDDFVASALVGVAAGGDEEGEVEEAGEG